MRFFILFGVAVAASGFAYIRLAPHDVAAVHRPIEATQSEDQAGGAIRVATTSRDALTRADAYMRGLPRTDVLAGSVDSGRITYVTRSQVFGFPDYTTVEHDDGMLKAYARLRFGASDMGVNAERLERLFAAIE